MKKYTEEQKKALRIAVAQDVLKQLNVLKLAHGVYVDTAVFVNTTGTEDLKEQARMAQQMCHTCALGACFLSYVALENHYNPVEDSWDKLRDIFSIDQLNMIEGAYEGWGHSVKDENGDERNLLEGFLPRPKYIEDDSVWYKISEDADFRLRKIMENIIANDGTFKP